MEWKKDLLSTPVKFLFIALCLTSCKNPLLHHNSPIDVVIEENFFEQRTCIIGDTGTGSSDQFLVAKALAQDVCHNIIHTGDLIYPKGLKNASSEQFQSKFSAPFKENLEVSRFFLTLGNHDYRRNPKAWLDIARENEALIYPHPFYGVKFKDACLTFIDTNLNFRKGQELWLQDQIKDFNETCKIKIAIAHHPLISSGHHGKAHGMVDKFLSQYILGNYDLYLAGHDHQLSIETKLSGTALAISGAGAKIRPIKNKKATYSLSDLGYMVLSFENDKATLDIKRVDESGIAHTAFTYPLEIKRN